MDIKETIKYNLSDVENRINEACIKAGRKREDVKLVAVSKMHPAEYISIAKELGQRDFGENKAQELLEKYETIGDSVNWHFIGHLQTNKVKSIIDKAGLIHSVDSLKLAKTINKEAEKKGLVKDILLEVNVAEEESKFGFSVEELKETALIIDELENLNVRGLMTVAPFVEDPSVNIPVFHKMQELLLDISGSMQHNKSMNVLSMGMSNDFETAIAAGANVIRIGTDIFGRRNYK